MLSLQPHKKSQHTESKPFDYELPSRNETSQLSNFSEAYETINLEEIVHYEFSSITSQNDKSNWTELIKNAKHILQNKDGVSIDINVNTYIDLTCIQYFRSFLQAIGSVNCKQIFLLNPEQIKINKALIELFTNNKSNANYQLIKHITECNIDEGTIKIRLNLDFDKYVSNCSDSMCQRFKNKLLNELSDILCIDILLIEYKRIYKSNKGNIWVAFGIIGGYLSMAFSKIQTPFSHDFVINCNRNIDSNRYIVNDKVVIKYRNREYNGEVIDVKKCFQNGVAKYDVTVKYLNGSFLFSNTETLNVKNNRIKLKKEIDIMDLAKIDGEIEGSLNKLKIFFMWMN